MEEGTLEIGMGNARALRRTQDGSEEWGYVEVRPKAHMFWWLCRSPYRVENPSKQWLIILWLQSGPDNPMGTAYGYVEDSDPKLFVKTNVEATTDLNALLEDLFNENEKLQKSPLYIVAVLWSKICSHSRIVCTKSYGRWKIKAQTWEWNGYIYSSYDLCSEREVGDQAVLILFGRDMRAPLISPKMARYKAYKPSSGPHKSRECLLLILILRNDETRQQKPANSNTVHVLTETNVVSIPKTNENFSRLYDTKGCFHLHSVRDNEAKVDLERVARDTHGYVGADLLLCLDAPSVYPEKMDVIA
ncbi:hypothetical protein Pint_31414 [Pistacia integerrima]|uniref:Uncharacterized protein n=1 Tax=Pistacia integerrima TaxID=434235 RepID=A0ACC0XP61_9ROSI|nr:hypothetical protein Pint_31414 [Pistacia integerrima]